MYSSGKKIEAARGYFRAGQRLQLLMLAGLALSSLALFSSTHSAAQSSAQQQLTSGVPITRELAGGQAHSYQLTLAAGQYLQVSVEQRGCDVSLALLGPDGAVQVEADSDRDLHGEEILAWVTQAACDCKLEIRSKSKTAGRYVLKTDVLRGATPQDADRVAAYRLQMEARKLQSQETAETMRQAASKYEAALAAWKNLGDQAGQAAVLLEAGKLYFDLADAKKSFDAWDQALALWRALGRTTEEGRTLSNLALLSYAKGEREKALEQYNQALALHRTAGDRYWEAETVNRIGWVYNAMEERQRAIEQHNLALPLRREVGDRRGEAVTLNDLGRASDALGEKQRAVEFYEQALRLSPPDENPEGAAQILIRLGVVHDSTGESQKALDAYGQALSLLEKVGNRRALASALNNAGLAYANLGDYARALEYYERALKLSRELGLGGGAATTLHNIGLVYRAARQMQQALDYHNQALASFKALNNRGGQAMALQALGAAHSDLGESQRALELFDQSLVLRRALSDRRGEAVTLGSMGLAWAALGETQKAHDHLSQALPLHRAVANRSQEAETSLGLARVKYELGDVAEARRLLDQSLQLTESIRANAPGQELRTAYFATVQRRYELGIDLLMRMHQDRRAAGADLAALELSERARARGLLELLTEGGTDIRQGVEPALLAEVRLWQQRLNARAEAQTRLLGGKHTVEQAANSAKEVAELTAKLQEAETQIRTRSPRYAALAQPQPLRAPEIQGLLDDDTLLLEYALGEKASYLWAITPTAISSYQLPPRAEIDSAARKVYALLTARQPQPGLTEAQQRARVVAAEADFHAQAAALSRMLLGPVAGQLGKKRLAIVAAEALAYLPFAVLPDPAADQAQPLLAAHEIVNLPSASVLAVIRREAAEKRTTEGTVAVFADPVFEANDPRVLLARKGNPARARELPSLAKTQSLIGEQTAELSRALRTFTASTAPATGVAAQRSGLTRLPFSREEAEAIATLAPARQVLKATGFQASRARITNGDLGRYRYLHFATHGLLNAEHPELSGLVLSLVDEAGRPQDGFLRLHEIYNLRLTAEVVVLSACQTALGKEVRGEGLIGLTRGFMYAGAPRVVASLWQVDDLATAELMKRFYTGMLKDGLRPAAALRAAQLELWKQKPRSAPFYWAAFVLQGEWR
jgi:CHAT domain-containing protein/tetratricopeptide (TPR) repeat protein